MMQVSTSHFYDSTTSLMQQLSKQADTLNTQIATTKKLSKPSDDVVAYQRLTTIKQANADDASYTSNISLASSLLQQSDTTLGNVETQLQRAAELAVQANSGTLNAGDRTAIATELQGIRDQLVSLANTKDARGQPLFAAATGDSAVTQAADGSVSFTGSGTPAGIPIGDGITVQPTESAARVFGGVPVAGGGTTDMFAALNSMIGALASNDVAGISAGGDGVQAALTQIGTMRASLGARAARVDLQQASVKDAATAREVDRSALEDTDVTAAITDLQKTMTVLQATQASFTKLSSLSLFNYLK
ncbi:flagellar hook-associated protein FlgL [Sphingomonas sp. AR_OL41]|uniref:flagellar hook-associated protein FlgL n=1 Tax=Sphingomonas sp. AR_OL41 TaxID=3042729 RepID=UPI00247FBABD|nr:flagellar hook-associated protein FlgL [Sphingomonas sp. AR_OL41]MDH7974589.1 flagellar hook-associated protein FlgL [Sphingomonas sp. AR_OL41]